VPIVREVNIEAGSEPMGFWQAVALMVVAFVLLAKCADWFVDGAVELARRLRAPPMLIGIVIMSLGTTAPELAVSVNAALSGQAEFALGNAVGSVIYDDGIALPLAILLAPTAIAIDRSVLRSTAIFLISVDLVAYGLCFDGTLSRPEGLVLVGGFLGYMYFLYWEQKRRKSALDVEDSASDQPHANRRIILFFLGLAGVIVTSEWIVSAAPVVAVGLGVPDIVVALTMIALGTSIPEVAACVVAARKGQGSLAAGNILGADVLNICWIAGASAVANPLTVSTEIIHFMFPAMLVIVFTMLGLMRLGHKLQPWKGVVLVILCVAYLIALFVSNPGALAHPE
jgi:cation:H+ antiporter